MNRVYDLYDQVRPEDVRDLAKKYLRPKSRTIVTPDPGGECLGGGVRR